MNSPFPGRYGGRGLQRRSCQDPAKPAKKVITIPINFVDSETRKSRKAPVMDENTAAVKTQAAFRGFYVRKTRALNKLRIIMKTWAEAANIRRRLSDEHFVELIGRDEKERVKITEWIMSLLLRLDEIQEAIPFVRESRKALIRDLIHLQDTVDHIISQKCGQNLQIEVSNKKDTNNSVGSENIEHRSLSGTEECGVVDKDPERVKGIEDIIGMVREENQELKRTVSDLLNKSEKRNEMIYDLSVRISQLEEHVSECSREENVGDGLIKIYGRRQSI